MYNRFYLGVLYLIYVVPRAIGRIWVIPDTLPLLLTPIIIVCAPFIAFFCDRETIITELEDVIGPIEFAKPVQQQPQQGWLREDKGPSRAWVAPIE